MTTIGGCAVGCAGLHPLPRCPRAPRHTRRAVSNTVKQAKSIQPSCESRNAKTQPSIRAKHEKIRTHRAQMCLSNQECTLWYNFLAGIDEYSFFMVFLLTVGL